MEDKTLILTIGLTDVKDTNNEWLAHSDSVVHEHEELYNLYKQNPDIEKASLSWKLKMDHPLVVKLIQRWEETIRRPHLKMISTRHAPFVYNKEYVNMSLNLENIALIPTDTNISMTNKELTDLNLTLRENVTWGALKLNLDHIYDYNRLEGLNRQIDQVHMKDIFKIQSLDKYSNAVLDIPVNFSVDLELSQLKRNRAVLTYDDLMPHYKSVFEKYESEFSDLGYTEEIYTKLLTSETLLIGEPVDSATVLYDTYSKYTSVCRISLTQEE